MKVLISLGNSFYKSYPELGEQLRREGLEVEELTAYDYPPPRDERIRAVRDAEIYIVGVDIIDREIMDAAPKLRLIIKHGAGFNNIDLEYAKEKGIAVTYAKGGNSQSVAELAMGLMFAVSRKIPEAHMTVKTGGWNLYMGEELAGKVLGLLGYGNIGRRVACMAKGVGMKVMAYDPFISKMQMDKDGVQMAELEEVLEEADYISVHIPATEQTKGMLNQKSFEKMKRSAYLINTSRGEIVNEEDLIACLKERRIHGAALDVFCSEPPNNEFLGLDNVVCTSHIGACTMESAVYLTNVSYKNVKNFINSQPLENRLV